MGPRLDAARRRRTGAADPAAAKRTRRHFKIHPLSGAALAAVLTVPVLILAPNPWPAGTTPLHDRVAASNGGPRENAAAAGPARAGQPATSQAPGPQEAGAAPGGPGAAPYFDLGRKDCVGTAAPAGGRPSSKIWYTVADGVLSDVYEPTLDNTNVATLQYIVTDGATFTDLQTRDLTYTVSADQAAMACTVTATSARHGYQLVTTYLTDPRRDSVLMRTMLEHAPGSRTDLGALHVYARLDAHVNGSGVNTATIADGATAGGATADGATADGATAGGTAVPVIYDASVASQAANRSYAEPTYLALRSTSPAAAATVGYAGSVSDGLTQLDAGHALTTAGTWAPGGHVVATLDVTPGGAAQAGADASAVTLVLGFGRSEGEALTQAQQSLRQPFGAVVAAYQRGWRDYDAGLRHPPLSMPGLSHADAAQAGAAYYVSANVLKASEDKTFPGAIVTSLAMPWGQAVSAAAPGSAASWAGAYTEVAARDLYEVFTGLLADGDAATARAAALFALTRQQRPSGEIPRDSLLNGSPAPGSGATQLDATAYPILMAYQSGLGGNGALWREHVRPAADFLVAHGPSDGVDRWGEQTGYAPSTIAAEIAALTAAAAIASDHGDTARALVYHAVADGLQRNVKTWTVTTTGPYAPRYFIRLAKTGDPDAAISYNLGNGGPSLDQRQVLDGGFQELVRLGILPASDPDVQASLGVWDQQMSVATPNGTGYYRYGDGTAHGSADGYGDCYQPSQTSCTGQGAPWLAGGAGTGHPWPLLSGERAESDIAAGDPGAAAGLLTAMMHFSAGVGLVPEQIWENPALPTSPYGTSPARASAGFTDGGPAGSAAPLSAAQAQELRLIVDLGTGQLLDQPRATAQRYLRQPPPAAVGVTVTAPTDGAPVQAPAASLTGTTAPDAAVVVATAPTGPARPATTVTTTAAADGSFSVTVPIGFGTDVLTVAASAGGGTGYAQVTVVGDAAGGTTLLDVPDPAGDDNGPGTYQYPAAQDPAAPAAAAIPPGSLDLTRFELISDGPVVYLRATLRTLAPVYGSPMGAQLLDVYVHVPGALATTAAAQQSRNYSIAPADAWSQRIAVQGFAPPVWTDASGRRLGTPAVVASATARTITVALPAAVFGVPAAGWSFAVVLTSPDPAGTGLARGFAATAQDGLFGLCAPGAADPICLLNPAAAPAAVDVLTPRGVSQAAELDPTVRGAVIQGVPVP